MDKDKPPNPEEFNPQKGKSSSLEKKVQILEDLKHSNLTPKILLRAVQKLEKNGNQLKKDDLQECLSRFQKVESSLWNQVLCQAAAGSQWKSIKLIVIGSSNIRPLAKEFDASTVTLSTLYKTLTNETHLRKSCHFMLIELLKHGAKICTFSKNSEEVFHILVRLVLLIESCEVLEYALKRNALKQSKENDLLLHTAVKSGDAESDCCFKVVYTLLQKGMNPKTTDSNGKVALEYTENKFARTRALLQIYTKDLQLNSESLAEQGNEFFQNKDYNTACSYYTVAVAVLSKKRENIDLGARLHSQRSQCFIELQELSLALKDASVVLKIQHDYKAHILMSKIQRSKNPEISLGHLYKAYQLLDRNTEAHIRVEIVQELYRLKYELKNDDVSCIKVYDVIRAGINLMKTKEFGAAEFTFETILSRPLEKDVSCVDVRDFCSEAVIDHGKSIIFEKILIAILDIGADLRNLTLYKGDTYFHAVTIMTNRTGCLQLLNHILRKRTIRLREVNLIDSQDMTALFRIMNEPNTEYKNYLIYELTKYGAVNGTGRYYFRIMKTLSKDVYLTLNDVDTTKVTNSTPRKKHSSKSVAKSLVSSKTCQPADPCSDCQKLYDCAVTKKTSDADCDNVIQNLVELCQMDHEGKVHDELLGKSIAVIIDQLDHHSDIPACLLSIKANIFLKIILKLASTKKWELMYKSLKAYWEKNGSNVLESFAYDLTAADFLNSIVFKEQAETYGEILTCLIEHGATMAEDPQLEKTALEVCITKKNYRAIIILLKNGLDPSFLTLSLGDTPLHAAAEIALRKDVGYFKLFDYLLDLHDSDSARYSHLNISCVNKDNQTLIHLACGMKYSKHSLRLLHICYNKGVKSDMPDASGKIPYEYIFNASSDKRIPYLSTISCEPRQYNIATSDGNFGVGEPKCSATPKLPSNVAASQEKEVSLMNSVRSGKKHYIRPLLKNLIDNMDDHKCKELHIVLFHKEDEKRVGRCSTSRSDGDIQNAEDSPRSSGGVDGDEGENDTFDQLEWEVECTSDVWKTLYDKDMPYKKRKQVIAKIQRLASGDWHNATQKIKKMPQTLKLFTLKLSHTSYIVWELAITFSQRCSDVIKKNNDVSMERLEGQIYSEIIRIWAVVFDKKDLEHVFNQIVKSHQRANTCHVQKQLQTIHKGSSEGDTKRLPRMFAEKYVDGHQLDLQRFSPPVSDKDDEYTMVKFYSFSTALVSSLLQMNPSQNIDFPFKVTEREHRIINLRSKDPIILLGRSGTGKTTCCVYRLWVRFLQYWTIADDPLFSLSLVKMREQEAVSEFPETEETEDDAIDEETDELLTKETQCNTFEENPTLNSSNCENDLKYVHLHQLFITKNGVLCNEVRKTFQELKHGSQIANKCELQEDFSTPLTFREITDGHFPLFLTAKKLWIILDASLEPPYFFSRQENLSLKHDIIGWSNEDDHLGFLPNIDDDDDDEDDNFTQLYESFGSQMKVTNQRQEVTYEKFLQLWPEINKPASGYHPSLVWTEIISFIKGSFEALHTKDGYLTKEDYIKIGRKRAPNFNGERSKVYQLFLRYIEKKRAKQMFDESDIVFNLYKRLKKEHQLPCALHEIYVDETQDFTQAELCLLIQLSENPNQMFLTGDTAQSIMRGVSFRFCELKSLFYFAEKHAITAKGETTIRCPKTLHKLLYNYRSHQGILKLASSVIDILVTYFQDSFDQMEKDQGLFDGPKPKLLESCSLADLSMLLRKDNPKDKRHPSQIEFGAHQAILVVDNESRDSLPEELSTALVLTIFEAKGLEFDDVLLYNFFKDSQASKEWRVVTKFLDDLVNKQKMNAESYNQDDFIKINWDVFQEANRPRPLKFDADQHKILNSELKLLYTALTRARVNLWIFDTDVNKRSPMFDFFKSLDLVQTITTNNSEEINELMFAEKSTPEMWLQRGHDCHRKALYNIAAKCYRSGGHVQQEKFALANHHALTAQRCPDSQTKKENFLQAVQFYMECDQHIQAAKCLGLVKEKLLSAEIFEKCMEYESAGKVYLLLQKPLRASKCFHKLQQFDRAVEILHDYKMYDQAIELIQEFNNLIKMYADNKECVPEVLIKHKPQKDLTYLCLQSADAYYKKEDYGKMKTVLKHLKADEKMEFLEKKGLIDLAADMLLEEGLLERSAQLMRRNGRYEKSIELARRANSDLLLARCLYTFAQHKYVKLKNADETTDITVLKNETTLLLEEAKTCYQQTADLNGRSLCLMLLSFVNNDKESAAEALASFLRILPHPNVAGGLQSASILAERLQMKEIPETKNIMKVIEMAYKILKDLKSTSTLSLTLREYLEHFGFHVSNNRTVCIYPQLEPLVSIQLETISVMDFSRHYPIADIKRKLHRHLLTVIEKLFLVVRNIYTSRLSQSIQCPFYLAGYQCQEVDKCFCPLEKISLTCKPSGSVCLHRHEPYTHATFMNVIKITKRLIEMDHDLIYQVEDKDKVLMKRLQRIMFNNKVGQFLLNILLPSAVKDLSLKTIRQFQTFVSSPKCATTVRNYLLATWETVKSNSLQVSNFFLESKILIGLFGLNISLERWINELCQPTHQLVKVQKPGVLLFYNGVSFCVYQRFVESLQNSDTFESLKTFTKYTALLVKDTIVLPSFHNLLFWCEFFVIRALMLFLRNQRKLVFSLPKSYINHSLFIDCVQQITPTFSLQTAIENSRHLKSKDMRTLWYQIKKIVILLSKHNIVGMARHENHIKSGSTERYVVLALVLLNCSSTRFSKRSTNPILCSLKKIGISDIMAPRMKESLHKLSQRNGTIDILLILEELMLKRGDTLGQYRWSYDASTSQGLQRCSLTSNSTDSLNSLKDESTMEEEKQDQEYSSGEEDEDGVTESEISQPKEYSKKCQAVNTITRAYKAYNFRRLLKDLVCNVSNSIAQESGNQEDYFTDIKVNEVGCNICGVSFVPVSPPHSETSLEAAFNEGEENTSKKTEMEEHQSSPSHGKNETDFLSMVKKYRQEFLPILKKEQEVLSSHEQDDLNTEIRFYVDQLNKTVTKLDAETREMCKTASWKNFPSLQSLLDEVKTASGQLHQKLSLKQIETANRDQIESTDTEDKELADIDDTQNIVRQPRSMRTKQQKGKY